MVKGFSNNEVKNNSQNTQIKEKKGLAGFLKGKKFTSVSYTHLTLPTIRMV